MTVAGAGARGDEGVLAAVLPASAGALVVDDASLAADLAADGWSVGDRRDAEVLVATRPASLDRGPLPPHVVVLVDGRDRPAADGGRVADVAHRVRAHAAARRRVAEVRRRLAQLGRDDARVLSWDDGMLLSSGLGSGSPRTSQRYPRRAVVCSGPATTTVLEDALRRAVPASPVAHHLTVAPGGTLLARTADGLLRVGVARGRAQVEGPAEVLAALAGARTPAVSRVVPSLLGRGEVARAAWSLEEWMPGAAPVPPLADRLLDQCVDVLAALHGVGATTAPPADLVRQAAAVHEAVPAVGDLRPVAEAAAERVAHLPRGVGHGDFWHRNLLASGGRLTGVVDWDSAGGGRLPFLDLMHLLTSATLAPGGHNWGRGVLGALLPWAQAGGDDRAARYGDAVGVPVDPTTLQALVTAYWLDFSSYQLARYSQRGTDPRWVRGNVLMVADALRRISGSSR